MTCDLEIEIHVENAVGPWVFFFVADVQNTKSHYKYRDY